MLIRQISTLASPTSWGHNGGEDLGFRDGRVGAEGGSQEVGGGFQRGAHGSKDGVTEGSFFSTTFHDVLCSFPKGRAFV